MFFVFTFEFEAHEWIKPYLVAFFAPVVCNRAKTLSKSQQSAYTLMPAPSVGGILPHSVNRDNMPDAASIAVPFLRRRTWLSWSEILDTFDNNWSIADEVTQDVPTRKILYQNGTVDIEYLVVTAVY